MTIDRTHMVEPLGRLSLNFEIVSSDGIVTTQGAQFLEELRSFVSGMARLFPCDASGTNVISLTPVASSPKPARYNSHDIYVARAVATSTGLVTATVVPERGSLATLKVYKNAGAAQATTGDVVADSLYLFVYAEYLDGGAGGFVLK